MDISKIRIKKGKYQDSYITVAIDARTPVFVKKEIWNNGIAYEIKIPSINQVIRVDDFLMMKILPAILALKEDTRLEKKLSPEKPECIKIFIGDYKKRAF
jgi:hypothetical protein